MKESLHFVKYVIGSEGYLFLRDINYQLKRGMPGMVNKVESVVADMQGQSLRKGDGGRTVAVRLQQGETVRGYLLNTLL